MKNLKLEHSPEQGFPNFFYTGNGFEISFNPSLDINLERSPETALLLDGKHFILNGDFREAYAECDSIKEAKAVFDKYKEKHIASWSD